MKTLMKEVGEVFLACVPAGMIIAILLNLLSAGGALNDAVQQFAAGIC